MIRNTVFAYTWKARRVSLVKQKLFSFLDHQHKTMFGSSWPPFVLFMLFVFIFVNTGVQHGFHIGRCSCYLTVTQQVKVTSGGTLAEHLSSHPVFRVARFFLAFFVMCCISLFVLFLLNVILFVLLRFTASDYPFRTQKNP